MSLGDIVGDGDAARVRVLHDGDTRSVEVVRRAHRSLGVDVVVVAHLLAVQLLCVAKARAGAAVGVHRGLLVRVLAIAQHGRPLQRETGECRPALVVPGGLHREPGGHRNVVGRGVRKCLGRQQASLVEREPAVAHGGQYVPVTVGIDDHGDGRVVLRRRSHHRRAADVDLLHALVGCGTARDGLAERIEVDHDEVERLDAELVELRPVGVEAQVGQDARVHAGVQRLDPPVEALREAGQLLDRRDRDPGRRDARCRRPGRHERHAGLVQAAREVLEPGLVIDTDQRAAYGARKVVE